MTKEFLFLGYLGASLILLGVSFVSIIPKTVRCYTEKSSNPALLAPLISGIVWSLLFLGMAYFLWIKFTLAMSNLFQ